MKKTIKHYAYMPIFLVWAMAVSQGQGEELTSFRQSFSKYVPKKMKKHNVVGASVAILVDGEVVVNEVPRPE